MGDVTITSRFLASPTTLILATMLAAVKPWGRIGRRAEGGQS